MACRPQSSGAGLIPWGLPERSNGARWQPDRSPRSLGPQQFATSLARRARGPRKRPSVSAPSPEEEQSGTGLQDRYSVVGTLCGAAARQELKQGAAPRGIRTAKRCERQPGRLTCRARSRSKSMSDSQFVKREHASRPRFRSGCRSRLARLCCSEAQPLQGRGVFLGTASNHDCFAAVRRRDRQQ